MIEKFNNLIYNIREQKKKGEKYGPRCFNI